MIARKNIEPGRAPGGLVVHIIDKDGQVLDERLLTPEDDDQSLELAAMIAGEVARAVEGNFLLAVYDGDDGEMCLMELWGDRQ